MAEVQIIGWENDHRWEEERQRVTECVRNIAAQNGFAFALVEDMKMNTRYRGGSSCVKVQFKKQDWINESTSKYKPAQLYFNEDCDLVESRKPNPEWFDEVNNVNDS